MAKGKPTEYITYKGRRYVKVGSYPTRVYRDARLRKFRKEHRGVHFLRRSTDGRYLLYVGIVK